MRLTISGFWTALLVVIVMIFILYTATRSSKLYQWVNPGTIIMTALLIIIRIMLPVELIVAKDLFFPKVVPLIDTILKFRVFTIGEREITIWQIFFLIWLIISIVKICRRCLQYIKMRFKLLELEDLDIEHVHIAENAECKMKINSKIVYKVSPDFCSPYIFGLLTSIIVLPSVFLSFDPKEIQMIFCHELNHHRKKDCIIKTALEVFSCIFWWFPFIDSLIKKVEEATEIRADWNVIKDMSENQKTEYLYTLYHLAEEMLKQKNERLYSKNFVNEEVSVVEKRFNFINSYKQWKMTYFLRAAIVGIFVASYLFVIEPMYQPYDGSLKCESVCSVYKQPGGTYKVYMDKEFLGIVENLDFLEDSSFENIMIVIEEEKNDEKN